MDDETTTDPAAEPAEPSADKDWQAEAAKWRALARKHEQQAKANVEAARRLATIEEASKSEQQRLAEQLEQAKARAEQAELKALRAKVAVAKGLPPALATRLQGTTEEEITADADELAAMLAARQTTVDLKQGSRGAAPASDPNAWLRRLAGRSR